MQNLRVSKNKKYLVDQRGKSFFWLADTWWYGMTSRTKWKDFKLLVKDRKRKGFNVIQIVVGVPPEIDIFSKHAANVGGLPFIKQNNEMIINQKYFAEVDRKIRYLINNKLTPCIFGAWGHHIDILGVDLIKQWWGEIVKRYAKYPVIWCLTGEADIFPPTYTAENSLIKKIFSKVPLWIRVKLINTKKILIKNTDKYELISRLRKWDEVARYIKKIDPYNRLLTVHIHSRTRAFKLFNKPKWLDIDSIQSGHSKDSLPFMISSIKEASKNKKPIINLEPWYEGILGNFGVEEQILAFQSCMNAGAVGHSYGAHGVWQMATKSDNFMGHWGKSDWKKAINYPGSGALGKLIKKSENNL